MNEPNRRAVQASYRVPLTEGAPDWSEIPLLAVSHVLWEPDWGIRAFGQFAHSAEELFVRLRAAEKDIRAEYTEQLSPVCRDSCLEFFFMPEGETRYFNFEINPNGCLLAELGRERRGRVALVRTDAESFFRIRTSRTDSGWEASYRIPLSFLRTFCPDASFAGTWRANVYKCGDATVHPHYLSWNPVLSGTPDFHRPQDFGTLVFG